MSFVTIKMSLDLAVSRHLQERFLRTASHNEKSFIHTQWSRVTSRHKCRLWFKNTSLAP